MHSEEAIVVQIPNIKLIDDSNDIFIVIRKFKRCSLMHIQ